MILWGVTDGSAGMQAHVRGVLESLGLPHEMKTARRRKPWCWLPVAVHYGALSQLTAESDRLAPPWPDAVVSSGRRAASIALEVKRKNPATRLIHLTDPRACRDGFDLIVAMRHDAAEGANIIRTHFALHAVTPPKLAQAATQWGPRLGHLERPYVAALIGGGTHKYKLSAQAMRQVIARLEGALVTEAGSLLITPSRRTGEAGRELLAAAFGAHPRAYLYGMEGDNPYLGLLALADHIIVTDDSVNMMSEACAAGRPVHILKLPGHHGTKPARFAETLVEGGFARWLALPLQPFAAQAPDEMGRVKEAVFRVLSS